MKFPILASLLAMGGTATGSLLENQQMDLKTVCAVGGIVLPATWWLSKQFSVLREETKEVRHRVETLEKLMMLGIQKKGKE